MNTTTTHLIAAEGETAAEVWAESEGLYVCTNHRALALEGIDEGYRLLTITGELATEMLAQGQCEICWQGWADSLQRSCEAEAAAFWDR
jgi:hypothetical protein